MGIFAKFRYFNKTLSLACGLIAVSTFNYGFDNQAFASTQAMDAFAQKFGEYDESTGTWGIEPYWLSLFNSLNYIGFAAGVLIGSEVSSRFGRRWCIYTMSFYALITATICVTAKSKEQIMAGRILNYVYVGMELAVVPVFQSEIVPAQARGFMVGSYQFSLVIGGMVINSVCFGTSTLPDERAFRIPFGLFYIVPTIVLIGTYFIPESPRWLLRKGKDEAARQNLERLRKGAYTDEEIDSEFRELKFSLEHGVEQGKFKDLFQGVNLKRTGIAIVTNILQQASGQAFTSQYGAIYVKSLGTLNPFAFNLMQAGFNGITLLCILLWTDTVGRRTLLFASSGLMAAAMMTMGGLGIQEPVPDLRKNGIISMITIFSVGFCVGWAPLCYVVTSEVASLRLRDLTARLAFFVNVATNFCVNFAIPYLIYDEYAGLSSKVGFIFGSIMLCSIGFVYFCVPECKGKSLEQVEYLFNQGVPLRRFGKTDAREMMGVEMTAEAGEKGGAIVQVETQEDRKGRAQDTV